MKRPRHSVQASKLPRKSATRTLTPSVNERVLKKYVAKPVRRDWQTLHCKNKPSNVILCLRAEQKLTSNITMLVCWERSLHS